MHVRHCPTCCCDYRPEIATCADCGGPLMDRDDESPLENDSAKGSAGDLADIPEGFGPLFTAAHVRDLAPLADRLLAEGIDLRLRDAVRGRVVTGYRLLVHTEDRERARACVGDLAACVTMIGDGPQAGDAEGVVAGYTSCPACETPLLPGAMDCPECGLPLASPQPACPQCGQELGDDLPDRCGNCGLSLDGAD